MELAPPTQRHALGVYQIVALLPVEHGEPQYSIKSLADAHHRCVLEFELRGPWQLTMNSQVSAG
jgi:hypothetical protein